MSEGDLGSHQAWFQLLGPVQLLAGSRPVPVGGPGVRGLLALLALHANKVVPLDDIIDALWGHDPPATARTIVHGNVSHLRRVLRSIQGDSGDGAQIHTRPPGYQLTVDPSQIDVHRARALLEYATAAGAERRAAVLAEALALWKGPVLSGVPDSVHAPELEDLRLAVHGARVDADLELGRHAELISELTTMVRENPLAERTIGQLMRALYHAGRRADALAVYRRAARHVVGTLGIDPGAELRELHDRILRDDLADPSSPKGPPPRLVRVNPAQLPAAVPRFAGRADELAWLDGLVEEARQGASMVGVVTGAPGVGKSALAISWAHRRAADFPDGVLFATLRGFDPEHPPLAPGEVVTQFLLGLGVRPAELPEKPHERIALYRSLLADATVLVVLDDARSAEQVRPLLPPAPGSVAVVTSRARLDGLVVASAARLRALESMPPADAVRLIEELAGPGDYGKLAELCAYLPLALRIAGARLVVSPQWTVEDLVAELADERTRLAALDVAGVDVAETSVRAALDVSHRGLPEPVGALFRLLGAFTGPSIGPHLAAALGGTGVAEARRRLRTLAAYHLLTEVGRDVFAPHDLVRLYLRGLAETELAATEREAVLRRSVRYYQAAADRARRRLLRIVDSLDFAAALPEAELPEFADFDDALDWFALEWPNLLETCEAAYRAGRYEDAWQLARVVHTYRVVRPLRDEWTGLVELGLAAAKASGNPLAHCWMLISRCAIALTFGIEGGGLTDAEHALALAAEVGDKRLLVSANIHVGAALSSSGRYDEAIDRLRQAIEETERTGDPALRGQALNNCAEAEKLSGRYAEAIEHQLGSLAIDRELGDDSYAVVSLNNLAELHLGTGELGEAERYARQAIELTTSRGFVLQEGVSRAALGRVLRARGDRVQAREQLELAEERFRQAGAPWPAELGAELAAVAE
ncbi:AfsR/SARP family transcriptional regulator [Amycolatopsis albispora]|uniref:AfsR/SARP family transcriptional regulator n=1 Tax=Amycolatopsis albispora TaxID=1804986 RepID=UPI001F28A472|nr:BTAD domain-containing putative transcriptional regulator [Amycolatopsis albispora]